MRTQQFGIEIEMTGITRSMAAKVIAGYFNTTATHVGGVYDAYTVRDGDDRQWKVVSDASLRCTDRNGRGASKQRQGRKQVIFSRICFSYLSLRGHRNNTGACAKAPSRRCKGQFLLRHSCTYQCRTAHSKNAAEHR